MYLSTPVSVCVCGCILSCSLLQGALNAVLVCMSTSVWGLYMCLCLYVLRQNYNEGQFLLQVTPRRATRRWLPTGRRGALNAARNPRPLSTRNTSKSSPVKPAANLLLFVSPALHLESSSPQQITLSGPVFTTPLLLTRIKMY